jgi:lipopolysaccharide exporter
VAWWFTEPRLVPLLLVLAAGSVISGFENIGIVEFRRNIRFDVQFRMQLFPRLLQVCVTIGLAVLLKNY